jgi:hypothetical protein
MNMDLKEFLDQNSGARAEYDKALADARTAGAKSAEAKIVATMEKVAPILASDAYDKITKENGIAVIKGEKSIEAFEAVVAVVDREIEQKKEAAAKGEQGEETPPNEGGDKTAEGFDKMVAMAKGR